MILYLDTSSLAKLYIQEEDSERVQKLILSSTMIFTSLITYPEMRSALSRRKREGDIRLSDYKKAISAFEQDWNEISKIPVVLDLAIFAGALCERYRVKGMDAIHLSSACLLRDELKEDIFFISSDKNQIAAAAQERLKTHFSTKH